MKQAITAIVLLTVASLLNAAPATLPTTTSDGVAYGEAQPIKGFNPPTLPTIGRMLGVPAAEWVGPRKIITRTQSSAEVQKIEQREGVIFEENDRRPEFVVAEPGHYLAFDVADGRICKVASGDKPSEKAGKDAEQINSIGQKNSLHVAAATGGGFLDIHFRGPDYFLATHATKPAIAAAIRSQKLIVGMTEAEADAAMSDYQKETLNDAQGYKELNYFSYAPDHLSAMDSSPVHYYKKTFASCSVADGLVNGVAK